MALGHISIGESITLNRANAVKPIVVHNVAPTGTADFGIAIAIPIAIIWLLPIWLVIEEATEFKAENIVAPHVAIMPV